MQNIIHGRVEVSEWDFAGCLIVHLTCGEMQNNTHDILYRSLCRKPPYPVPGSFTSEFFEFFFFLSRSISVWSGNYFSLASKPQALVPVLKFTQNLLFIHWGPDADSFFPPKCSYMHQYQPYSCVIRFRVYAHCYLL